MIDLSESDQKSSQDNQITEALRSLYAVASGKLSPLAANREIDKAIILLKLLRGGNNE